MIFAVGFLGRFALRYFDQVDLSADLALECLNRLPHRDHTRIDSAADPLVDLADPFGGLGLGFFDFRRELLVAFRAFDFLLEPRLLRFELLQVGRVGCHEARLIILPRAQCIHFVVDRPDER